MSDIPETVELLSIEDDVAEMLKRALARQKSRKRRVVVHRPGEVPRATRKGGNPLFVVSRSEALTPRTAESLQELRRRVECFILVGDQVSPEIVKEILNLKGRSRRVHIVPADTKQKQEQVLHRLGAALVARQGLETIVDAWVCGDRLVVLSSHFHERNVRLDQIPPFEGKDPEELKDFDIDEDGSYLYWKQLDVHLGWEELLQIADPDAYLKARRQSKQFNRRYGAAIREFRKQMKLRQADIEGLDPRQVRRIENGQCRATHSALEKLANAHGMSTADYMSKLAELMRPAKE